MVKPREAKLFNCQNGIALVILLLCLLGCLWFMNPSFNQFMANLFTPLGFRQAAGSLGIAGPLTCIGLIALSVGISLIPGAPLAVIAGVLWGPIPAGIYSVTGEFLGSLIAYYLGRTLGRWTIKAVTGKTIFFSKGREEIYLGWLNLCDTTTTCCLL